MARSAKVKRKTRETDITVEIGLDGRGVSDVATPIPFFSHMLENFSRHGLFDLKMRAKGDVEVDLHHTVEDVGIALGEAVRKALGGKAGIKRCASATVPMMDSLSTVTLDISGRPNMVLNASEASSSKRKVLSARGKRMAEAFDMGLLEEFMKALSTSAGIDLHITLHYGRDIHHSIESIFKALGRALGGAVEIDRRIKGVMSTKGVL